MSLSLNKKKFLELIENQNGGLFLICSAKQTSDFAKADRCDADNWGPTGAVRVSDNRFESIFGSGVVINVSQLEQYKIVYDFNPHGFLIYIKLRFSGAPDTHDIESENYLLNLEDPPCAAKNLGNLLKLIIEWSRTKEDPWLNYEDPLSEICSKFIEHSSMPENIIEFIDSNYEDMQVYKYLKRKYKCKKSRIYGEHRRPRYIKLVFKNIT